MAGKAIDTTTIAPVLAMAALSGGDGAKQARLEEYFQELLEEQRAKKARRENQKKQAIKATQDAINQKSMEKKMCSHRNKMGRTRLGGQYLSGTHQLCLVCTWCNDEFHKPAFEGQKEPPPELIPSGDVIGG